MEKSLKEDMFDFSKPMTICKVDNQEIKLFMNSFRLYQLHSIIRSQKNRR